MVFLTHELLRHSVTLIFVFCLFLNVKLSPLELIYRHRCFLTLGRKVRIHAIEEVGFSLGNRLHSFSAHYSWRLFFFLFKKKNIICRNIRLPVFGIFNMHADVDVCSCTWGLHKHCKRVCTEFWGKYPLPHWESNLCQYSSALSTELHPPFSMKVSFLVMLLVPTKTLCS